MVTESKRGVESEFDVDIRDWALDDPGGQDLERVREIRDEIEQRVVAQFDEFSNAH